MKRFFLIFTLVALLPCAAWGEEITPSMNVVSGGIDVDSGLTVWQTPSVGGNTVFSVDGAGNVRFEGKLKLPGTATDYGSLESNAANIIISANGNQNLILQAAGAGALYLKDGGWQVASVDISSGFRIRSDMSFEWSKNTDVNQAADTKLSRAGSGIVSATNAIQMGSGVSIPAGVTAFAGWTNTGVTPASGPTEGAGIFAMYNSLYSISAAGTITQIASHDRDTNEPIHNSWNVYTGQGERINLRTGERTTYTVAKTNPELAAKENWIAKHISETSIIIPEAEALETVPVEEDAAMTEMVEEKVTYALEDGKVKLRRTKVKVPVKSKVSKQVTQLKADYALDAETGLIHRNPTRAEAEAAAVTGFQFDWQTMPKFVREAWGK